MKINNPRGLNNSPLITLDILKKQLDTLSAAITNAYEALLVGDDPTAELGQYGYVPLTSSHVIDPKYYDDRSVKIQKYQFTTDEMNASSGYVDNYSGTSYITLDVEIPGFVLKTEDAADNKTFLTECEYTPSTTVLFVTLPASSEIATEPLSTWTFNAYSLENSDGSSVEISTDTLNLP